MEVQSLFVALFIKLGYTRAQAEHLDEVLEAFGPEGGKGDDVAAQILKYGKGAIGEMERLYGHKDNEPLSGWLFPTYVDSRAVRR